MDLVLSAYWICLLVGIGYTVIAFILGGIGGHGDVSAVHTDSGHIGVGDHDVSGDGGQVIFGPFSPLVIAFFLTCFGATGVILGGILKLPLVISLPGAFASSFVLAWLLVTLFNRLLGSMQSSSEVKFASLVGSEGEVTVEIPVDGIGEIAYVAMGGRYVASARNDDVAAIPRFSGVRVTRVVGNMLYVRPLVEEKLRDLDAMPAPEHPVKMSD